LADNFKVRFWAQLLTWLEMEQDNLNTKLLAFNAVFTSLNFAPLPLRSQLGKFQRFGYKVK